MMTFEVFPDGVLSVAGYEGSDVPDTRGEMYGVDLSDAKSADEIVLALNDCDELWERVDDEFRSANRRAKKNPDELLKGATIDRRHEIFRDWIKSLSRQDMLALVEELQGWLDSSPDDGDLDGPRDGVAYAFMVLQDEDETVLDSLEIELTDGVSPGDDTQLATLNIPVDKANAIAKSQDLKYRFVKA